MRFDELNLEDSVLDGLYAMNFQEMTPVQEMSIPPILEGKDIIACAQTGTGKTAAYVLPVINELSKGGYPEDAINAVIMAPTRELAQQIDQQVEGFSYYLPVSAVAVYGGTDGIAYAQQERGLQMGADIVIATPGRLIAHMNLGSVDLSRTSFFILDEADRMLDMGFYDDIIQIYKKLPGSCQIIMFSATMPPKIRTLAASIMKNPQEVEIAISKPPESIMQTAYICHEAQKMRILEKHFKDSSPKRVLIFSSSKLKVKELAAALKRMKINVEAMHSDLEQSNREQVMKDFRNGHVDVLVATDVVSRGIDINDISIVINYDIPKDPEDYVHRIGRTARGTDGHGLAITLVSEKEQRDFKTIETFLGKEIYKIPVDPSLGEAPSYEPEKHKSSKGRFGRGRKESGNRPQKDNRKQDNKGRRKKSDGTTTHNHHKSAASGPDNRSQKGKGSHKNNPSGAFRQDRTERKKPEKTADA
jgi:superfamily II DNA/RNA helicase